MTSVDEQIASWFPYGSYRPHQQDMLRSVYTAVAQEKTVLINAPTGSGKSSNVAAVLAATTVRPVIIAVRTVFQLNIFVRELEMIRRNKMPNLRFSYVVGKGKVCNVYGEIGVNERCKMLKKASATRIAEKDIQMDLSGEGARFDAAAPTHCPWYVASKCVDEDTGRFFDSEALCDKADAFGTSLIDTDDVKTFAGEVCPYEMMRRAAQDSDVVIVNYQHVLNPSIRKALLGKFYTGDKKPVLICDEAHNLGAALEELHSIQVDEKTIEKAIEEHDQVEVQEELKDLYSDGFSDEVLPSFFDRVTLLIREHDEKFKGEEIFDYQWLWSEMKETFGPARAGGPRGFLDDVFHILEDYQQRLDNRAKKEEADRGCKNLIRAVGFLLMLSQSLLNPDSLEEQENMAVIKIFMKKDRGSVLKLRTIDPSSDALELMKEHRSLVLMSGTFHPPNIYGKYLFGDEQAQKMVYLSLPNVFPQENRKLVVCVDVTSTYKAVTANKGDNDNNMRIFNYVHEFIRLPGNLAVYFPSYSMLRDYTWKIQQSKYGKVRKFYVEPQNAREAARILEEYMDLPSRGESGVLLAVSGGKFSEGIDYRGETMVGVMVVGLPLAAYSPVMQRIIKYYEKKFGQIGNFIAYTLPALNRAQQALGRVIRTETDRGFLVLCERRYLENMKSLPSWMKDEAERCVADEFTGMVQDWKFSGVD